MMDAERRALGDALMSAPVDRGAVLRDAADFTEAMNEGCGHARPCASCDAREDVADALRRLAGEAPQPETQARPPRTEWQIEFQWRDSWCPDGSAWEQREDAASRYESAITRPGGRPQRLIRQETTYAVEAEHAPVNAQPAAGSAGGAQR